MPSLLLTSAVLLSSRIMSMHNSTHSSQMNTVGPAMSFRTSCWLFPQNEQYSVFLASPSALAIVVLHADRASRYDSGGNSTVQPKYITLTNRSADMFPARSVSTPGASGIASDAGSPRPVNL